MVEDGKIKIKKSVAFWSCFGHILIDGSVSIL